MPGGLRNSDDAVGLLVRERTGRELRAQAQREWPRLRAAELHPQEPLVRIKSPTGDEFSFRGQPVERDVLHISDGQSRRNLERDFPKLPLRRAHSHIMGALQHTRRRDKQMIKFGIEDSLLRSCVSSARFPGNRRFRHWRKDEIGSRNFDLLSFGARCLDGNRLRRIHVHLALINLQFQPVDQPERRRQDEAVAAILFLNGQLVLERDVELAALFGGEAIDWLAVHVAGAQLQGRLRVIRFYQHRRRSEQIEVLARFSGPFQLRVH